jgi:hypothetical protein
LRFHDAPVERVQAYKYLGVIYTSNLNFEKHADYVLSKARKSSHLFWKYIARFHSLTASTILNLFNVLVTPVLLLYNAEIWLPFLRADYIEKLDSFLRTNFKRILGVGPSTTNPALYLELDQTTITVMIAVPIMKMIFKMRKSDTDRTLFKSLSNINCKWTVFWENLIT